MQGISFEEEERMFRSKVIEPQGITGFLMRKG